MQDRDAAQRPVADRRRGFRAQGSGLHYGQGLLKLPHGLVVLLEVGVHVAANVGSPGDLLGRQGSVAVGPFRGVQD